jgi:dihydrofolate reductase
MQCVVVAVANNDGGLVDLQNNRLWSLLGEVAMHLNAVTESTVMPRSPSNAVIMGRKTWDAMVSMMHRPLPNRLNIVVSSSPDAVHIPGPEPRMAPHAPVLICASLQNALDTADNAGAARAFVLGGARLYEEAITTLTDVRLMLVRIQCDEPCAVTVPGLSVAAIAEHWKPLGEAWRHEARDDVSAMDVLFFRRQLGSAAAALRMHVPKPATEEDWCKLAAERAGAGLDFVPLTDVRKNKSSCFV